MLSEKRSPSVLPMSWGTSEVITTSIGSSASSPWAPIASERSTTSIRRHSWIRCPTQGSESAFARPHSVSSRTRCHRLLCGGAAASAGVDSDILLPRVSRQRTT